MLYSIIVIVNNARTAIVVQEKEAKEWLADREISWYDEVRIVKNDPGVEVMLHKLDHWSNTLDRQLFYRFGLGYNTEWEYIEMNLLKHKKYGFIARIPE